MKTGKLFYIFLSVVALAVSSPAQEKTITEEEFEAAVKGGISKMEKLPRKIVTRRTEYKSGVVSEIRETVMEHLPPDKFRLLITVKEGDAVRKTEIISLKNAEYLRENGGKWVKRESDDGIGGFGGGRGVSNIKLENSYSVEEAESGNKRIKIFTNYTTLDMVARQIYTERKTFIDDQGLIRKVTTRVSHDTKENVYSDEVITYEYNPKNLQIVAPIK